MNQKLKIIKLVIVFLFFFFASIFNADAFNKLDLSKPVELIKLHQTKDMASVNLEIVEQLKNHYKKLNIDNKISEKFFYNYIKKLDPNKNIFILADIKEMEETKTFFDDAIKQGYLDFAFTIYNAYQKIEAQRLIFSIKKIEEEWDSFDFKKNDIIKTDPEKYTFPIDIKDRTKRWVNKIKNDILVLEFADKKTDKIQKILSNRYRGILRRLLQVKEMDIFQIYINSFASLYDAHTNYFSPNLSNEFSIHMKLSFEGIGATLSTENEHTKVVNLIPGGPAEKANNLKAEDIIVGVGQGEAGEIVDIVGWRIDDVVKIIRGKKKSYVRLEIIPKASIDKKTKIIKIVRGTVTLKDQEAKKKIINIKRANKSYKIGVINIPVFYLDFAGFAKNKKNYKSVSRDVIKLLKELNKEKTDGSIIDLRQNGGGSLVEAQILTGLFIKEGPIVQVKDNNNVNRIYKDENPAISYDKPIVVLIDRYSASASEIFAGAIKDYKRGLIVGSTTFGKGTVQNVVTLSKGSLKYTNSKFYRISGESTQHKGVVPDIELPAIYNEDEVGESSYDITLPWDKIKPVSHNFYGFVTDKIIKKINNKHKKRIAKDPYFIAMKDKIKLIRKIYDKTEYSLNRKNRKKESDELKKQRLSIINKKRKAEGKEPIKTLKEAETNNDKDIFLEETKMILCDYIEILRWGI